MESQYESDTWDQTERDDADDVGEREEETFEVEELEILGHCQEWRQAGKKKPAVLLSIWEEMQGLDRNKELRGSKVQTKCKDDLMEEQLAAAEDIVERWNGRKALPETKARNAAKYGYKYVRNFAMEMWRYWNAYMDFNNEITDGIPFNDVRTLEGSWREYLGETFEEPGTPPEHDGESSPERARKKTAAKATRTGKVDSVKLVKNANGEIWIGEIVGLSRDQLQKTVHGFMTAHYQMDRSIWQLQPPVDRTLVPLQVVRQQKYQKTPAPKYKKNPGRKNVKGKGKAQEEGVAMIVWMIVQIQRMTVWMITEAEGSDVGTDDPSTKRYLAEAKPCQDTIPFSFPLKSPTS
ncbi:hypothetical protein BKA82DRAFT_4012960 [Pisolithus tinctorius]|nr:hypothetical protein BKA82DRAFT_4012960 [Pisolithus tinctorius]